MKVVLAPNPTGSGHNMRMLSLARQLRTQLPEAELTVLLGSLQPTFTPLFESAGVHVIDVAGTLVDTSTSSHLTTQMDWSTYIGGYVAPAFVNGDRVLGHLAHYRDLDPDLVVSDYNISASMAAAILGVPHALVTERYDFTLHQLDDATLEAGGFEVDREDMRRGREALHALFSWIVDTAEVVLTDKPPVPEMDRGTAVARALDEGRAVFTGPMIRDFPAPGDGQELRRSLGLGDGPVIVGSVGGTTMFLENKQRVIDNYLAAHRELRRTHPDLQLVLLGREKIEAPEGVVSLTYLPDWMPLLQEADLLLSAPGWITVTEVAAMNIPTLFVLGGLGEYHEVEAARRLDLLGYPTLIEPDAEQLAQTIAPLLAGSGAERMERAARAVAPEGSGTAKAAGLLAEAVRRSATRRQAPAAPRSARHRDAA
ncbi:hypothetical protein ABZ924_03105 [Streptomyces sp. NPDC046876]|uniref:hypothetical protein n=1 Tax=Streptomyces sp. NPDC046876 TaxID=3155616 RepID=UPI0033DA320E